MSLLPSDAPTTVYDYTPDGPCRCAHCNTVSATGPNYRAGWGVAPGGRFHCPEQACFRAIAFLQAVKQAANPPPATISHQVCLQAVDATENPAPSTAEPPIHGIDYVLISLARVPVAGDLIQLHNKCRPHFANSLGVVRVVSVILHDDPQIMAATCRVEPAPLAEHDLP